MTRYLVVANQTLGGERLEDEVRQRIEEGGGSFHVVVPMTLPSLEVSSWVPGDVVFGVPNTTDPSLDAVEQARQRSRHRLGAMVRRIGALGGEATGEVGDPDPVLAVQDALDREDYDEVIVSTLPAGVSRWLRLDLQSRLARHVDSPVTVVEAERAG